MSELSLKISGKKFDFFNEFQLSLEYNSVASVFSFTGLIISDEQKELFRPLSFHLVQVLFNNEILLTGTGLNTSTSIENQITLGSISGYSKPGVLGDCEIPLSMYPLQSDKLTLKEITEKLIKPFGIKLIVDKSVESKVNKKFEKSTAESDQKIIEYIIELAQKRNIVVTHDNNGNLVFTSVKFNDAPVAYYYEGMPSTNISLSVDGQGLHSEITVQKQATIELDAPGVVSIKNKMVTAYRPNLNKQNSGDNNDTDPTAQMIRASELRNITLTISTNNWIYSDGQRDIFIKPNQIIEVFSPANFINKRTKFFVEKVDYTGNESGITMVMNCVLPECYNNNEPINIFE